jgi:hypothetical protein
MKHRKHLLGKKERNVKKKLTVLLLPPNGHRSVLRTVQTILHYRQFCRPGGSFGLCVATISFLSGAVAAPADPAPLWDVPRYQPLTHRFYPLYVYHICKTFRILYQTSLWSYNANGEIKKRKKKEKS